MAWLQDVAERLSRLVAVEARLVAAMTGPDAASDAGSEAPSGISSLASGFRRRTWAGPAWLEAITQAGIPVFPQTLMSCKMLIILHLEDFAPQGLGGEGGGGGRSIQHASSNAADLLGGAMSPRCLGVFSIRMAFSLLHSIATWICICSLSWQCEGWRCTMRFGSTAKVLLECKLKYYRISE